MTQEALKKMYQLLLTEPHAPTVCAQLERIAREALAEHAMREVQRLGQEIEHDDIASILACRDMLDAQPVPPRTWVGSGDLEDSNAYLTPPQRTEQEPVAKYCCHLCFNKSRSLFLDRMILCPECGNKRCPKATNHELQCTNSNELNQAGSVFTTPPQRKPLTDEQIFVIKHNWITTPFVNHLDFARTIEAAHGIKE